METVLVTGGAGYIGSHMTLILMQAGYNVIVLDNLSNGHRGALDRASHLAGKSPHFVEGDLRDTACLESLFRRHSIEAVMHFAGLKAVGESCARPMEYYHCNVGGTLNLIQAMKRAGVDTLVFSSSATVYGHPDRVPIREDFPLAAINPYGMTKLHIEDMLRHVHAADPGWRIALLRYFNPVGAHESGLLGEDPQGTPNNLMPFVAQVAGGRRNLLQIFGGDYPTADGTGVRDYIHVMDLVEGHLAALHRLFTEGGLLTANLGTGKGYSVLEMVNAFAEVSGRRIPYRVVDRRPGDVAVCYADPSYARETLAWRACRGLEKMCDDHWRWQKHNPLGYRA